jgi:hypothetical protein
LFSQAATLSTIDDQANAHQLHQPELLKQWSTTYPIKEEGQLFWYGDRLVIMDNTSLKRGVISLYQTHQQQDTQESLIPHGQSQGTTSGWL